MIHIYYGKSSTGKTTRLLEHIKNGAQRGKKQILIVPETKTFEMEKTVLGLFERGASPYVEVVSQTRLAHKILGQIPLIGSGGKVLITYKAVTNTISAMKYYKSSKNLSDFCTKLTEVFQELKSGGVPPEKLLEEYEKGGIGDHIADIAVAYSAYCTELDKLGTDDSKLLPMAAEKLAQSNLLQNTTLYFDGFSGFTYGERILIEQAAKLADDIYISLMTNGTDSLFTEQNKTIAQLAQIGQQAGQVVEKHKLTEQFGPKDILVLDHLYDFTDTPYEGTEQNIQLLKCPSPLEECQAVAAEIRRLATEQHIRYSDMAVVCGQVEEYERLFAMACREQSIPVFVADKTQLLVKPVLAACIGAVKAVLYNFSYDSMFSFLKSGLLNITPNQCYQLENYVVALGISGAAWGQTWRRPAVEFNQKAREEDLQQLTALNELRQQIIAPLLTLKQAFAQAKVGKQYIAAFRQYLEDIAFEAGLIEKIRQYTGAGAHREAAEYAQVYEILLEGLEQFLAISGEDPMTAKDFVNLLSLTLSQYAIAAVPSAIDQIELTGFRNLPAKHPQALFILGATDVLLPPASGGGTLISEAERYDLADRGVELALGSEEYQTELESHIYRCFVAAKQNLTLSYPVLGKGGEEQRCSYLWDRVLQLCPKAIQKTVTPRPLPEHDVIKNTARGPVADVGLVRQLYGDKLSLSASRIEKISSCPYAYFMEYGLKAKPRRKIDFDARAVGSFLHKLVEQAVKAYVQDNAVDMEQVLEQGAKDYFHQIGNQEEPKGRLKVILQNIVKNAALIVEEIIGELQNSDFQPAFFEFSFGSGTVPPYEFQRGQVTVSVNGKIDRVDAYVKDNRLYLKVVDYKSGRKSFQLSDLLYGLNVQMFLYLMMLQQAERLEGFEDIAEKEAAAVLYVPLRNSYEEAVQDTEKRSKSKRDGYVLDELDILSALEHPQDGKFQYLPVKLKKDGNFDAYSAVLSGVDFGKVFKRIQKDLEKTADLILDGVVSPNPYQQGPDMSSCTYCPFQMACRFDSSDPKDKPRAIKNLKTQEVLERMDSHGG